MYEDFLRDTFQIAIDARNSGDGAYGALILNEQGEVLARAGNTTSSENSVTYHAEINAIQLAESIRGKGNLSGCMIICSAEPCPMCAAAIIWSGLGRVVYGAGIDALKNAGQKQIDIYSSEIFSKADREIIVKGPMLEQEAVQVFDK